MKYTRVGFAHPYHGTLYNGAEIASQVKILQHRFDVAIEIGYQHHRVFLIQCFKNGTCVGNGIACSVVAVTGYRCGIFFQCLGRECACLDKIAKFYAHFYEQQVVEGMMWQYVACAGELAFGINIRIAKYLLVDGHTHRLISVPDNLTPVYTTAVDSATVIEYNAFNIFHLSVRV